jgi:hypothetical protein
MIGSYLVPFITPLAALSLLAIWLGIVYHAAAHPEWKHRPSRADPTTPTPSVWTADQDAPGTAAHVDAIPPGPAEPAQRAA